MAEETLRKRRREEEEKEEKERKEKEEKEKEGKDNDNEKEAEAEAGTKESADKEGSSSPPPAKKQKLRHSAPTSPSFSEALIEEEERTLLEARLRDAQVLGLPFPPFMDILARVSPPCPHFSPEPWWSALFALTPPPPPPLQLSALQAEDKARVAAKEEEEREKEPKTWKERFYVQHLDALLDQRFQWPQETFM